MDKICKTKGCENLAMEDYDSLYHHWEFNHCESCLERLEKEYQERREWQHAHSDI